MTQTATLCFTKDGLINLESIAKLPGDSIETMAFFIDGTEEAFDRLAQFNVDALPPSISKIAIGRTPMFEMRVQNRNDEISAPHYIDNEDVRMQWVCRHICAHYLNISMSHVGDDATMVALDPEQVENICYLAYRIWSKLKVIEDRTRFPAILLDRLLPFTYYLTRETMDINALNRELGVALLRYNSHSDMLSTDFGEDTFTVSAGMLNHIFAEEILPLFTKIGGRKYKLQVALTELSGAASELSDVRYGELGRHVEQMARYARERRITHESPLSPEDLIARSQKVRIDAETCYWLEHDHSFKETLERHKSELVRHDPRYHRAGADGVADLSVAADTSRLETVPRTV
jgi:hypothetical protein